MAKKVDKLVLLYLNWVHSDMRSRWAEFSINNVSEAIKLCLYCK